jgi:hypothetical protein
MGNYSETLHENGLSILRPNLSGSFTFKIIPDISLISPAYYSQESLPIMLMSEAYVYGGKIWGW